MKNAKPTLRWTHEGFWVNWGKMRWNARINGVPFGPEPGTTFDYLDGPFRSVDGALMWMRATTNPSGGTRNGDGSLRAGSWDHDR